MACSNRTPPTTPANTRPKLEFAQRRMAICGVCQHNIRGVCELVKDIQLELGTNKEGKIEVGAMMPEAWCPIGRWDQHKETPIIPGQRRTCTWCRRYHDKQTEVCSWCRNKMEMERRNAQKGIGGFVVGQPYDTRLHELRPRPFTSTPVRNLHYFIYPRFDSSVRYHLDQLRQSIDQFNGKRVCCIAIDDKTLEKKYWDEIHSLFTDVHVQQNDHNKRELVGFVHSLAMLESTDVNQAICFAHAKGQQPHTANSKTIRMWTDAAYETCVRNWEEVEQAFTRGYPVSGVFKSIGSFRTTAYKWHYSGAFWWARSVDLFENPSWKHTCNRWWAAESYVGRHWYATEGHCLFGNNTGGGSLYNPAVWSTLNQELEQWRKAKAHVTA